MKDRIRSVVVACLLVPSAGAWAQLGPAAVDVTAARLGRIAGAVDLPGTVEARVGAVVASLTAGPVVEVGAREGDRVRKGSLLARVRREDLEQDLAAAKARRAEAMARRQQADQGLARAEELFASGVMSQKQLDDARSEADAWRGSELAASSEISRLEVFLRNSRTLAPFTGVVVREHCELGEWLEVGGAVAEVMDLGRLEVVVSVPERYFAQAREGGEATVRFDALPGLEARGKIVAVIPRADPQSRAFPVKVAIANPEGQIGVGMSASVSLAASSAEAVVLVPKDSLLTEEGVHRVYRIEAEGEGEVARPVEVKLGRGQGSWVEVEGLSAGDLVVVRGNERLAPGLPVAARRVEVARP